MTLWRPSLLMALASILAGTSTAWARLGETREECIVRYGQPVAEVPALLENAIGASFMLEGIRVRIEFLDGKAGFISFSRSGLGMELRQELLVKNGGALVWNPPGEFLGRMCWTAPGSATESPRHASAYTAGDSSYLDLAVDEWAKAMKAQQAVQFAIKPHATTPAAPAGAVPPAAPAAPPAGKLKGF